MKYFFDPQTENQADPDGMTTDSAGNLYFAMRGGIWVVSKEGEIAWDDSDTRVCEQRNLWRLRRHDSLYYVRQKSLQPRDAG